MGCFGHGHGGDGDETPERAAAASRLQPAERAARAHRAARDAQGSRDPGNPGLTRKQGLAGGQQPAVSRIDDENRRLQRAEELELAGPDEERNTFHR